MLFEYIQRFVNDDKDEIGKIKLILRQFRFSLMMVYEQLISDIITSTKKNFMKLLKVIPELLPYEPKTGSEEAVNICGLWSPVTEE